MKRYSRLGPLGGQQVHTRVKFCRQGQHLHRSRRYEIAWLSLAVFILTAALTVPIRAQEQAPEAQEQEHTRSRSPDPADWEIEVYQAKHQKIDDLMSVLHNIVHPYQFSISSTYNTLTLRAPRDAHQMVDALIKRFDEPTKSIRLQFYLLRGVRQSNGPPEDLPQDLQPLLSDLSEVTQFQSFQLIAAPSGRTRSGESLYLQGGDVARHGVNTSDIRLESEGDIRIDKLTVEVSDESRPGNRLTASMRLSVDLKDGETVVLGSSQLRRDEGTALIVILRATVLD